MSRPPLPTVPNGRGVINGVKTRPTLDDYGEHLSAADYAAYLGVCLKTVYEWNRSGKLPGVYYGHANSCLKFPKRAIEAFERETGRIAALRAAGLPVCAEEQDDD